MSLGYDMDHFTLFAQARDKVAPPCRLADARRALNQQSSGLGGLQRSGLVQGAKAGGLVLVLRIDPGLPA